MTSLCDLDPSARHAAVASTFGALVDGAADWSAPAPVDGWTARDVVTHLLTWFPGFLADGGQELPSQDAADLPAAWRAHAAAVQAVLDDPARAGVTFAHPHLPPQPLAEAVDRFYTADVFMHSWDLARATGQEVELDPDFCEQLLAGMAPMEEVLRSSGQYGPAMPVPDGADAATRLAAFIGRDPSH